MLRVNAGVTVSQTAAELGCGEGKVQHMENGRNVRSKPDLTVMIALYGASAAEHETDATLIRNFEVELIPGLLQIPEYAREVHELGGPKVLASDDVERKVAARLKRQELPFSKRLHLSMAGGFILLDFPPDVSPPVAYYDHVTGGQLIHDVEEVKRMSEVYAELTALSMSADDTLAFIAEWL
jgi:Domain of unknown function (DUF5753)/Helix-turn-helix domain